MGAAGFGVGDNGAAECFDFLERVAKLCACEDFGEAIEWILKAEGDVI